jgi:hypothetical protein
MDVLDLFTIPGVVAADKIQLAIAFQPVKTWNYMREAHRAHPGILLPDNPDNADIAGPHSAYDYFA